jgi:hypothetical protein
MKIYQVPGGYPSFEAVENVFKENLPEKYKIESSEAGGRMPMFSGNAKMVGTLKIRQNSYNGIMISLTSTDGSVNDNITINDYIPSFIIRLLDNRVLGYIPRLIFPAIYGTSSKSYEVVDNIIMKNFKVNELDVSMKSSIKNMFTKQGPDIKRTSISDETEA